MAKVTNPNAKPKKNGTGPKKTGKVTNPTKKGKSKAQIKEVPKPADETPSQEEPKVRVMNDEVIQEHILIRRNVNGMFVAQLSRIFTENAGTFIETFLSLFNEKEKAAILENVQIRKIELVTYEALAMLTSPGSALKDSDKAFYNILRDLSRQAEGIDDDNIPSEIIALNQYVDQPVYIVLREGAYIFGLDSYLNDIRKDNPEMIVMLAIDPKQMNEHIANILLLHMTAWITNFNGMECITQEKIEEFIGMVWQFVTNIAGGAINATASILTSSPNTVIFQIVQNTKNPNFTIQTFYNFRGVHIMQVIDNALVVEKAGQTIEELLAGDGTEEGDKTLMDVIDEE